MSDTRVLFVDDEPAILNALRRMFRKTPGYRIETAPDGPTGLEVFRRFQPSVVVSDSRMPGMSGVEFLMKAREIDPEPVRVMLTGCTDLPAAEAAINQGEVWRFITKPWNDEELRSTIAGAHERFRLVAENRLLVDKLAAIGMLAGGVAHEINNPLGGVLAYCEILRREAASDPGLVEDLQQIEDAALRAKRIVADLLDFARTAKVAERRPTTLSSVVEKALALARFQLRDVHVVRVDEGSSPVLGDANRLQQVVLNLLTNAVHALAASRVAGRPGNITVRVWQKGPEACLSVRDDGPGVAPGDRERIFDAFFTTKGPGEGTGLGLTVSLGIVRDHGGRIELESPAEGGAEFVVAIPSLPSIVRSPEAAPSASPMGGTP